EVTGFWWGVYVRNARDVVIEHSHLYENGWKDPTANGTGYGISISNSQDIVMRNSVIADNGNEGIHLSESSLVTVEDNTIVDNGKEQLYLIRADQNIIRNNRTAGGTQGLEMRFSSNNAFSYNVFAGSPLHFLENDNLGNTFYYDSFEGRVAVGEGSVDNVFQLAQFVHPGGVCLSVAPVETTYVFKSHFGPCMTEVAGTSVVTLDRSVNDPAKVSKGVRIRFPGCTADFDLDARVDVADRPTIEAAMNTAIGEPGWNAEADLDRDGDVDTADLGVFETQLGPCGPNLAVTALSDPPPLATPGSPLAITDTVRNRSIVAAGKSRTQYYFSPDPVKSTQDKLLGGRKVAALGGKQESTATVSLTIPAATVLGTYYLVACADDTQLVEEMKEGDNCLASTTTVEVGRPDLVATAVTNVPATAVLGKAISVTDTVKNQTAFQAGASRTRFYLSADGQRDPGDQRMTGYRAVPILAAGDSSTGAATVTIPATVSPGDYFVLACADDLVTVPESDESNNCVASAAKVKVGRPDLTVSELSDPPASASRGGSMSLSDTVKNDSLFSADASRVQYYLSLDGVSAVGGKLLTGYRPVEALGPGATSAGTRSVIIPSTTTLGSYFVLACADAASVVTESDEGNNCRASVAKVTVQP
ncbi:MAG: CARDB domain-containing protein, partial [Micromonosporaceae bacterium]